jgi:serine/threonine protein kinase
VVLKKADTPEAWNHEASDFINKCILRKPTSRLGLNGPKEVKSHVWFKDFDWTALISRKMTSPFIPSVKSKNFDKKSLKVMNFSEGSTINANIDGDDENPHQERMNKEIINDPSFQQLFNDYRYDIDEEKRREQEAEEAEKRKRNAMDDRKE